MAVIDRRKLCRRFAALLRRRAADRGLPLDSSEGIDALESMTGIEAQRLRAVSKGARIFTSLEIQVLASILGIGMEEVFPEPSDDALKEITDELEKAGAAPALLMGIPGPDAGANVAPDEYRRTVARLHFYARCLRTFK